MFALRSLKSAVLALALVVLVLPNVSKAAYLGMPQRLTLQGGGDYTTDATPTFTWGAATNATWYDASIDGGTWYTGIGNNFSYTSSWLPDGWHTVYVRSHDNVGDVNANALLRFEVNAVANDNNNGYPNYGNAPVVPLIYPSTATEDEVVTLSVQPYGDSSVNWCDLYVNGTNKGSMNRVNGNLFERDYTFANDGTYDVYASCTDVNYRTTVGASRTVTVYNDGGVNNGDFVVSSVSPSSATEDEQVTISVRPNADNDVNWCDLYVNGLNKGDMDRVSSSLFEKEYTFTNDGSYTVYAVCTDENYRTVTGTSRTITVYNQDDSNNGDFTVPAVYPSTATEDEVTTVTVTPYGNRTAEWCDLYVNGSNKGAMTRRTGGTFEKNYTFTTSTTYTVYAYCTDQDGRSEKGVTRSLKVTADDFADVGSGTGRLIKIACASGAASNDPCKAVYYYGDDNMRHAFPNEGVYFSWYSNFDSVEELSASSVSRIALGKNVTYKPGSVLIQFASSSDIYAVSRGAILHKYLNTSLVRDDWGSSWSSYLVTVPESYFGNYTRGSVIDSSGDYDRNTAQNSVDNIDDNF